jgi:hypothetical protein
MGHNTDYIGRIDVHPPLNEAERAYLTAFSEGRRFDRPGGPYAIPGNPAAERCDRPDVDVETYNRIPEGQPSLWCDWVPCWEGCCLAYNGNEKFYNGTRWMAYLIDHFLAPGAHAQASGEPWFDAFTFDHHANGIIAGCRQDTRELFLLRVVDNRVSHETLVEGRSPWEELAYLGYEEANNERRTERRGRRSAS